MIELMVLMRLMASAPASLAARPGSMMSATLGVSFTMTGIFALGLGPAA